MSDVEPRAAAFRQSSFARVFDAITLKAHEFHDRYKALGLPVEFHNIQGAAHGGAKFHDDERTALMRTLLTKLLK